MNIGRAALATAGGTVAYFLTGFLLFTALPRMMTEARKHAALFRSPEDQMARMPMMMAAMLVAIFIVTAIYARSYRVGHGLAEGLRFGALVGLFVVFAFVVHNYVNLNLGLPLTLMQAVAYFIEWTVVGGAIGLLYRPPV